MERFKDIVAALVVLTLSALSIQGLFVLSWHQLAGLLVLAIVIGGFFSVAEWAWKRVKNWGKYKAPTL